MMKNKSLHLNLSQKRDKLRTQGDIVEDTSGDYLEGQKQDGLEANLSDVEMMLRFHGVNGEKNDELLQAS